MWKVKCTSIDFWIYCLVSKLKFFFLFFLELLSVLRYDDFADYINNTPWSSAFTMHAINLFVGYFYVLF